MGQIIIQVLYSETEETKWDARPNLRLRFENALPVLRALCAEQVTIDIFVAQHALWVDILEYPDEIVEARVQLAQAVRTEVVRLRPVWPAAVASNNLFVPLKELPVRYAQTVWPTEVAMQTPVSNLLGEAGSDAHVLVLHDTNPAHLTTTSRAEPDIICVCEANLNWEVRPQSSGIRVLPVEPRSQFLETGP